MHIAIAYSYQILTMFAHLITPWTVKLYNYWWIINVASASSVHWKHQRTLLAGYSVSPYSLHKLMILTKLRDRYVAKLHSSNFM